MDFLLRADGRWNRVGEYGCLYTALSRDGAIAEFHKVLKHAGLTPDDYEETDLGTIIVEVAKLLDLTDPAVLSAKGLTTAMMTADTDASLELCRSIADAARAAGYPAILSPSAARTGETNFTIYIDRRAADVTLEVGTKREPLNY